MVFGILNSLVVFNNNIIIVFCDVLISNINIVLEILEHNIMCGQFECVFTAYLGLLMYTDNV